MGDANEIEYVGNMGVHFPLKIWEIWENFSKYGRKYGKYGKTRKYGNYTHSGQKGILQR